MFFSIGKLFILIDRNNFNDLNAVFKARQIDYIFHYAAILGVQRVTEEPLLVLPDINGIQYLLDLAYKNKVRKVIFASSSVAYGFSTQMPLREDDQLEIKANQSNYVHLYALVKLIGEKIMEALLFH